MSRNLSNRALASINASETDEVWLALIKLTRVDFAAPIRLVVNTEDVTSNGELFLAFPFEVALPDDTDEELVVVEWKALNVSKELIAEMRSVTGPIDGELTWVLADTPDVIEMGPMNLQMRMFDYDASSIKGSLVIEPILDAVFGSRAMDGVNAPGLF